MSYENSYENTTNRGETWKKWREAWKKWDEARKNLDEARKKWDEAREKHRPFLEKLHRKECGCKEWNCKQQQLVFGK